MDYIAIVRLQLNGNTYESGDTIAPEDVPTTKLRSMVDKGLIEAIGSSGWEPLTTAIIGTQVFGG